MIDFSRKNKFNRPLNPFTDDMEKISVPSRDVDSEDFLVANIDEMHRQKLFLQVGDTVLAIMRAESAYQPHYTGLSIYELGENSTTIISAYPADSAPYLSPKFQNKIAVGRSEIAPFSDARYLGINNDSRISRSHAYLGEISSNGHVFVQDLGSLNGTHALIHNDDRGLVRIGQR